jgi:uncharacterized protein (TIGR00369 family)
MDEQLRDLFEACLEKASEEDRQVLHTLLSGVKKKQDNVNSSYIGGILHMDRTIAAQECRVTLPVSPLLHNTLGIVHGGITATAVDSAMGTLANSLLPEGCGAVTTQLNIHYLAVGKGENIVCTAALSHKGTKTMVLSADVYRSDGRKIAQATGSFFVIEKK